jgi:hypothetical protein
VGFDAVYAAFRSSVSRSFERTENVFDLGIAPAIFVTHALGHTPTLNSSKIPLIIKGYFLPFFHQKVNHSDGFNQWKTYQWDNSLGDIWV